VLDLLQTLNVEQALTIVLVTHSTFAATYGQRTIEMQDGTIKRDVSAPRESSAQIVPLGG
jgi:ABC-type lipoprotein export system ATPase subunit